MSMLYKKENELDLRRALNMSARDEALTVSWSDLKVRIKPSRVEILHGVSGEVKPGTFAVLLGPSGSGKSTLLSALSERFNKKLQVDGSLTYNGQKYNRKQRRLIGFCEQDDILLGDLTVRETLFFAAALRRKQSKEASSERAEAIIQALGLSSCSDQNIGGANINRSISGGQRRRASIGVELVLDPQVLLLDEPTSGLDSTAATRILDLLRAVADAGRTVIASLHQPNDFMYSRFDTIGLMSQGYSLYFGPAGQACHQVEHSLKVPPKPDLLPCADYLLDIATHFNTKEFFSRKEEEDIEDDIESCNSIQLMVSTQIEEDDTEDDKAIQSTHEDAIDIDLTWFEQFRLLCHRSYLAHRLDAFDPLFATTIGLTTVASTFLWYRRAASRPRSYNDIDDVSGLFFFQSVFFAFQISLTALFAFPPDLELLKKERAAGLYRISAFFLARTVVDTITACFVAPVSALVYYFSVGLKPTGLFLHLLAHLVNGLVAHSSGLFIGASVHSLKKAATVQTIAMLCTMIASGYFVSQIPLFLRWFRTLAFLNYSYGLLMKIEFTGTTYKCEFPSSNPCDTLRHTAFDEVDNQLSISVHFGILVLFVLAFRLAAYLSLRFIAK